MRNSPSRKQIKRQFSFLFEFEHLAPSSWLYALRLHYGKIRKIQRKKFGMRYFLQTETSYTVSNLERNSSKNFFENFVLHLTLYSQLEWLLLYLVIYPLRCLCDVNDRSHSKVNENDSTVLPSQQQSLPQCSTSQDEAKDSARVQGRKRFRWKMQRPVRVQVSQLIKQLGS